MPRQTRVFLSAVTSELGQHRSRLALELRRRGLDVVVQDDFRQHGGTLLEKLKKSINTCDAVICLIGHAYGAEPPIDNRNRGDRRSYTQWEFTFAFEQHKSHRMPLLVYLKSNSQEGSFVQNVEESRLQSEFRDYVIETGLDREPLSSEDDLVIRVLQQDWAERPRIAWRLTLLLGVLALSIASMVAYTAATSLFSNQDRVQQSITDRVEYDVQEIISRDQIVLDSPDSTRELVTSLPQPDVTGFTILRKDLVWDARQWKIVTDDKIGSNGSALTLRAKLVVRKDTDSDVYVRAPKTSGSELFCRNLSMYPWKVYAIAEPRIVGDIRMFEHQLHYDISSVPVGSEFTLLDDGTFWNSMQVKSDHWVGLVGDEGMRSASNLLILPEDRPWKRYWATTAVNQSEVRIEPKNYDDENYFFVADEENHRWIYWEILNPKPGYVYQLRWE